MKRAIRYYWFSNDWEWYTFSPGSRDVPETFRKFGPYVSYNQHIDKLKEAFEAGRATTYTLTEDNGVKDIKYEHKTTDVWLNRKNKIEIQINSE